MRTAMVVGRLALAAAIVSGAAPALGQGYDYGAPNGAIIVDQHGRYHGNANGNQFDPNSVSNQFGRYGSQFSPDSINNQFGAGNPYNGNRYRVIGR
ncbi:UNVERIFIED_ORG: hypothetical protein M2438_002681 [Methylobacterium sp. SuP10 SLI 274]|uniref:hypothetical protein n=1 Tax=Methylorubrum extorquens TaxID=408 RepID=UPI0020A1DB43|nr:hypothetical protein [Methylorubrum extorquens]MDF9863912.1 hypothetical protein [Methylorubrum pseudosasae]MDH6637506.1 hypothetical protein [Methylobacterium sp. SuP10 SLI 274]MDH6666686.1 hypothetical protein [Methylorubrum zatmanii]MCP1558594.1 hypothetical protein [Methylorubrum extorquens]MDF9792223.1 hypothetical protein [Methylorubrum extorquens]